MVSKQTIHNSDALGILEVIRTRIRRHGPGNLEDLGSRSGQKAPVCEWLGLLRFSMRLPHISASTLRKCHVYIFVNIWLLHKKQY